mgnify:CR=1 FL=1
MLNKFKYKNWTFVEYINPKKSGYNTETRYIIDPGRWSTTGYKPIYKTGVDEKQIYNKIIEWFKHVENDQNLPDVHEVWDALTDEEAGEWFKNSKKDFIRWWNSLSAKLKHYYTDRLEAGKSLLPDDLPGIPDVPNERTASLQMTIINDRLALSSVEISVLDKAREMIETVRGITEYEYRTTMRDGEELHTYIFDLK